MELTEKERLLLVGKKEEIRKLTEDIIELTTDINSNKIEIQKKVQGVLSLISTLACYTNSKLDMRSIVGLSEYISQLMQMEPCLERSSKTVLAFFCNIANTMTFNFTKRDLKISIQKIDLSLIKTGK